LCGAALWLLRTPASLPKQIAHVIEAVLHPELAANQLGDPANGPHIASEAKGLSPTRQELGQLSQLLWRQSRRRAWLRSVQQRRHTSRTAATDPSAHGAFGHPQRRRNLALRPAFLLQIPGAQPPPFAPVLAYPTSLGHDRTGCTSWATFKGSLLEFCPETFN
jgi:hypothetical protein